MLSDRFGNALSTASVAARDTYVRANDLLFALWTGAGEAFDAAIAEDPDFALAHIGAAQVAALRGDVPRMVAALAAARAVTGVSAREASQVAFFGLRLSGQSPAALEAARVHLEEWPRDAVVMNHYAPIIGLINDSGCSGSKREQAMVMDGFARHYGDDWWYIAHHAMALSEVGRVDEARILAERSLQANPQNIWAAHARAHVAYEGGEADGARGLLEAWLPTCPREAPGYGHVAWHLAIAELGAGNMARALDVYTREVAPGRHLGALRLRAYDCVQFAWRWELAGNAHDPVRWQAIAAQARAILPHASAHFADIHAALADAVTGDIAALDLRIAEMEALIRVGRYPKGSIVPDAVRGLAAFARGDHAGAIDLLSPLLAEAERIGGSRAQEDLVEFTVLRACIATGRRDELQRLLSARRRGPLPAPVAGLHGARLHGAGLHGAGLHGAGLHGAGLHGAGLHGAGHDGPGLDRLH